MINYNTFELDNGLRVIHHLDHTKATAVLNVLYNVGARDENPNKTGFAHLFEHLMFGGSVNISSYDGALQNAGGTNNAFTSNDITNYYIEIPVENIETAFWLESDRMLQLDFSQKSLDVQKGVVIEEFKQRYLNQPYGEAYLHMRPLAYQKHPYRWATIGKEISHIENTTLEEVKNFFHTFYNPNNAILCVAGNLSLEKTTALTQKWFSSIPKGKRNPNFYPKEPTQLEPRRFNAQQINAQKALYIAFHKSNKFSAAHFAADLFSDIISTGKNSILYQTLVEKQSLFTDISAYVGDEKDPGLFYIVGKLQPTITIEQAEKGIWETLETIKQEGILPKALLSRKNKLITSKTYQDTNLLNKAMALCFALNDNDIGLANSLIDNYISVSVSDINQFANNILTKENSNTLVYDNTPQ